MIIATLLGKFERVWALLEVSTRVVKNVSRDLCFACVAVVVGVPLKRDHGREGGGND